MKTTSVKTIPLRCGITLLEAFSQQKEQSTAVSTQQKATLAKPTLAISGDTVSLTAAGFFPLSPGDAHPTGPSSHGRRYSKNTGNSALRKMERSLQSTGTEWSSTLKERWGHRKEDWGKRGDNPLLEWQAADCTGMAEESSPMAPLISILGKGSFVWLHLPCLFLPETTKGLFSVCVIPSSKGTDWIW